MTVTLHLKPELEAGLLAQAQASGMTPEGYLQYLVEKELSAYAVEGGSAEGSGMLWEDGLLIYGAGTALPAGFIDQCHQTFPRRKIATSPGPPRLKRFFDSSVLIPAFYKFDNHHDSSAKPSALPHGMISSVRYERSARSTPF